jgi:hypothetical protein
MAMIRRIAPLFVDGKLLLGVAARMVFVRPGDMLLVLASMGQGAGHGEQRVSSLWRLAIGRVCSTLDELVAVINGFSGKV